MDAAPDFIGSGWSFPVRINGRGGIALSSHGQELDEAIRIILSTPLRHRVMRPEFGCRIHELVFAPINAATITAAQRYVEEALARWEPRIDLLAIRVATESDHPAWLRITISYRVRATYDERTLVYPFYTIPEETV